MFSNTMTTLVVVLVTSSLVRAGFRCSIGNFACSVSCVTLGQTSGICDGEGECICSERSIRSVPGFSNLIGRVPTMLGSHWSRASDCCLRQQSYAILLAPPGSLWHKDSLHGRILLQAPLYHKESASSKQSTLRSKASST